MAVKDPDVPFEIRVQHRQFVHWYVENHCLLHDGVLRVAELLTCHHHVVHGRTQFTADGVRRLLPPAAGSGHQEAPSAESLRMNPDDTARARYKDGVEHPAADAFLRARDLAGTDFQARVEAAVGGDGLVVRETSRRADEGNPGEAGDLADARSRAQDTYHFVARDSFVPGFPVHGEYLAADTGHIAAGLGDIFVVKHVFLPDRILMSVGSGAGQMFP